MKEVKEDHLIDILSKIPDPEIPVISIVDLGIVRSIEVISASKVKVVITPTYSGCPAMKVIEDEIRLNLLQKGFTEVIVETVLSPAWTTDWISEEAKNKLKEYGIAPPEKTTSDKSFLFQHKKVVSCPNCGSDETEMISQFGSTACKALYRCLVCKEPFDYFKCI
jgi:ring-1,2-phenylacetyl-CoA epoxidase subunit PaaD